MSSEHPVQPDQIDQPEQLESSQQPLQLCKGQKKAVDMAVAGYNLLIFGDAYSGKLTCSKHIAYALRGKRTVATVGATTYSALRYSLSSSLELWMESNRSDHKNRKRFDVTDTLIIFGPMMNGLGKLFSLSNDLKIARKNMDVPFGGMQVIVFNNPKENSHGLYTDEVYNMIKGSDYSSIKQPLFGIHEIIYLKGSHVHSKEQQILLENIIYTKETVLPNQIDNAAATADKSFGLFLQNVVGGDQVSKQNVQSYLEHIVTDKTKIPKLYMFESIQHTQTIADKSDVTALLGNYKSKPSKDSGSRQYEQSKFIYYMASVQKRLLLFKGVRLVL